ncbi:MAG TPA: hypothetical protein VE871_09000 [Longimicrobium sp.]|nr:hypothetical protein [Longimicrobium sp.]
MPLRSRLIRLAPLALLAALLGACEDGPSGPPPALSITATGTLQRGATVTLSATREGQAVPAGQVAWTVVPAAAGELLAGGQLRLLAAGTVEVRGSYDGSTGRTQLQVADLGALVISAAGRTERGSTLTLTVTRDGQAVPAANVTWTLQPSTGGEVLPGGQVRLLAAGALEVRGSFDGSTGALPVTVAVPPTLVFDMSVAGNRDLYSIALDGGGLTRITDDPAVDSDPSVAAGKILFVSVRAGNPELYVMPAAGGAATRITTTAARSEASPALSPDGTRMAYTNDVSGVARIWTANVDGTGAAAFTGGLGFAGSPETAPSWAPTGNRLSFVGTGQGTADIWDLTAGGTAAILAGGDSADVDPAWNPGGTHVAFASTREGDPAIFTVRVSDRLITRLSTRAGAEAEPSWTADGRLVYIEFGAANATRLVWIDPAQPAVVHEIPVTGNPRHPSVVR